MTVSSISFPHIFNEEHVFTYTLSSDDGMGKAINYRDKLISNIGTSDTTKIVS